MGMKEWALSKDDSLHTLVSTIDWATAEKHDALKHHDGSDPVENLRSAISATRTRCI
jgi:glutamine synthetase type III